MMKAWIVAAMAASFAVAAQSRTAYVAASFNTNSIYFLDEQMEPVSSFSVEDPLPNAVAATQTLIYAGYFLDASVVAYDYSGAEHFRWSSPGLTRLTGIAAFGPYIAASSDTTVYLFQAKSGRYMAQLSAEDSIEGLAYDGHYLWTLGSELVARDIDTGLVVHRIDNAAIGCDFAGTGIASAGNGHLMLGCNDGRWFDVSVADGSVQASGNNGLDMFDLAAVPVPEPSTASLVFAGLALVGGRARKRWCRLSDSNR